MVSIHRRSFMRQTTDVAQAGLIAVSIGLGAEKLGRTISDKRLERKEKKAIAVCCRSESIIVL
jgi:hypothetical protein